jgi:K+-sensing histidine kinase KdpD
VEIVLTVLVGVAAFVVAAVVSTAARSHVPAVLLGLLLLLAVLAVARFAGILSALPVGVATILAFDWYFLPPLRNLDGATVLVLGLFLGMSVIVGAVATQAGRRAAGSERARGVLADEQAAMRRGCCRCGGPDGRRLSAPSACRGGCDGPPPLALGCLRTGTAEGVHPT